MAAAAESVVAKLAKLMKPTKIGNRWRKPEISRRQVAKIKKQYVQAGREWPLDEAENDKKDWGGTPIQDLPKVWQKGHKVDKLKIMRQKTIEENMQEMPKWVAEYRERVRAYRRGEGLSPMDKFLLTPKQQRKKLKQQQAQR